MDLTVTDKPGELGLSAERLDRIGRFFDDRYVQTGKIPGALIAVARKGQVAYVSAIGHRDVERRAPVEHDTIYRIYSMTKSIVSVALMALYEEGHFQLNDPVSRFIPSFERLRVWLDGNPAKYRTTAPLRDMTVRDLLTHTSGLTYGFNYNHPVDALYRRRGVERPSPLAAPECDTPATTVEDMVERLADVPLLFSPGTSWNYSVSTDVCGRLVEILSGQRLDAFLQERILGPLGMVDTAFHVPADKAHRLAANYAATPAGGLHLVDDPTTSPYLQPTDFLSGGGGLASTAGDYLRFTHMLLNKGELDGVRILGRRTVEYMTMNHLPDGVDIAAMGPREFNGQVFEGIGFGLGFAVTLDPTRAQVIGSAGSYNWGGAASTAFWIDPAEELTVVFMTQLVPSSALPLRPQLRTLTYQAIVD